MLDADQLAILPPLLDKEGPSRGVEDGALTELVAQGCLQPLTLSWLQGEGLDLKRLAQRLAEAESPSARAKHAIAGRRPPKPPSTAQRAVKLRLRATAYLLSKIGRLESLLPSETLSRAQEVAIARSLIAELIPVSKGLDLYAARRRALTEALLHHALSPDAYAAFKPQDMAEVAKLLGRERELLAAVLPRQEQAVLAVLSQPTGPDRPTLDSLNAALARAAAQGQR